MFAMIGDLKSPDLLVRQSNFEANYLNGVNATGLHSLIQLNETSISSNLMNGLQVHGGAGDVSLYHCSIQNNLMNGVNITYAGGLKELNYTTVKHNRLYGVYINYNVQQEMQNIFQNTTINSSLIESNVLGGAFLSSYCNQSNITINGSIFRNNLQDGLIIESCNSPDGVDWFYVEPYSRLGFKSNYIKLPYINRTIRYAHVNISWNQFEANRLNGLKIVQIQNMIGIITNNTFSLHEKGALLITANSDKTSDSLIRNVSMKIQFNTFYANSGRYALNVGLNSLADQQWQSINVTFNRFEQNDIQDAFSGVLNTRGSRSAVAVISSPNIRINQNWFDNPASRLQIGTHLNNLTAVINASYNWFNHLQPVYDLNYFLTYRDKCNQQWPLVRQQIFDNANRSNLAQIIYWPYACNEKLWFHEASSSLRPPMEFDFKAVNSFGGVLDTGDTTLPARRYTVTNDILVKPGAKLSLKPGTELNFLNGVGMLVLGELHIDGVQSSPVRFNLANQPVFQKTFTTTTTKPYNTTLAALNNTLNETRAPKIEFRFGVELTEGRTRFEGRLKVNMNGIVGSVCNRGWTLQNSKIACQQLGFVLDPSLHMYSSQQDSKEPILMSEVQCDPLDTSLIECRFTAREEHTCTHQDDVWIRCLPPGWAGVRIGASAQASRLKYALFQQAGQYDYANAQLGSALQLDLNQHELSNLTFTRNQHTSLEILFNEPMGRSSLNNLEFYDNNGAGLLTRSSFVQMNQVCHCFYSYSSN